MLLSIISPTYNEAQNIEPFILSIKRAMKGFKDYEIIFVDDNSKDKTYEVFVNGLPSYTEDWCEFDFVSSQTGFW